MTRERDHARDMAGSRGLKPVDRPDSLTELAYTRLRQALMTGVFMPGQRLTARTTAAALGMSMTPLREAMGRLVAERGLAVDSARTVIVPVLTPARVEELTEIRISLEGLAAERGAPRLTAADLERLETLQLEMVAAREREEVKKALQGNEAFHFTLYEASGMEDLISIIRTLWVQIGPSMNLLHPRRRKLRLGMRYHTDAIAAARRHDAQALRRAIELDIAAGAALLRERLSTAEEVAGKRPRLPPA